MCGFMYTILLCWVKCCLWLGECTYAFLCVLLMRNFLLIEGSMWPVVGVCCGWLSICNDLPVFCCESAWHVSSLWKYLVVLAAW
jgi:hypothetical protein